MQKNRNIYFDNLSCAKYITSYIKIPHNHTQAYDAERSRNVNGIIFNFTRKLFVMVVDFNPNKTFRDNKKQKPHYFNYNCLFLPD